MSSLEDIAYQEVTWDDVHQEVRKVNPKLSAIIDKISPNKNLSFIKAKYAFGDLIVNDGQFNFPHAKSKLSTNINSQYEQKLRSKLAYSIIPLTLLLNKPSEVFIGSDSSITPLNIIKPGCFFGTFETLNSIFSQRYDSNPVWNVSAGVRSVFMLPRLNDTVGLKKLKINYDLSSTHSLKEFSDQWSVFSHIIKHPNAKQNWHSSILMFTNEWFDQKYLNDSNWADFTRFLFVEGWNQAQYAIERIKLTTLWRIYSKALAKRNFKPVTYLSDTLKHIFNIILGFAPGFRPVSDMEIDLLPVDVLHNAIIHIYGLKNYHPTIMVPHFFNYSEKIPVYYSLSYPTLIEGSKERQSSATIMLQLKELKNLIEVGLSLSNNKFSGILDQINFNYFHVEDDLLGEILSSKLINQLDKAFTEKDNKIFCYNSNFWRGCIKIS